MHTTILTVPGLSGSGPQHWQTRWEQSLPGVHRVMQSDWDTPSCSKWVANIEAAVARSGPETIIVAHSLGCIATAHWARQTKLPVKAALLVAPADAERPSFPETATGFTPIPLESLPFPTIVAASTNDEYCSLERAAFIAGHWGSRFVNVGDKGHINALSGLEDWAEGQFMLRSLLEGQPAF